MPLHHPTIVVPSREARAARLRTLADMANQIANDCPLLVRFIDPVTYSEYEIDQPELLHNLANFFNTYAHQIQGKDTS